MVTPSATTTLFRSAGVRTFDVVAYAPLNDTRFTRFGLENASRTQARLSYDQRRDILETLLSGVNIPPATKDAPHAKFSKGELLPDPNTPPSQAAGSTTSTTRAIAMSTMNFLVDWHRKLNPAQPVFEIQNSLNFDKQATTCPVLMDHEVCETRVLFVACPFPDCIAHPE